MRHFLTLRDCDKNELLDIIDIALELKFRLKNGIKTPFLQDKVLAMIFEKSSTRTRISFEVGIHQLGGMGIFLSKKDIQLDRGEPIKDTARVISSMCDMMMMRTDKHSKIEQIAKYSQVPVINGLSDDFHPTQLIADYLTMVECGIALKRDNKLYPQNLQEPVVAYVGDGNNMCNSWLNLAGILGFELRIASPKEYEPKSEIVANAKILAAESGAKITITNDIKQAIENANVVVTDTWSSMGQEEEKEIRKSAFSGFCIDSNAMNLARKDAIFLHCLPAYRGQEVSEEVLEGAQSRVFLEAENRLHAQKGIMLWLNKINNIPLAKEFDI